MNATLTSKGQITIPIEIRNKLRLKPGDVLDFDEKASILTARRVIDPNSWNKAWDSFRERWQDPYPDKSTGDVLAELRGPVELPSKEKSSSDENSH